MEVKKNMLHRTQCPAAIVCLFILTACGGGGNGKGDAGSNFHVSTATPSISFTSVEGAPANSQSAIFVWTGTPPDTVYVSAIVEGAGIDPVIPVTISSTNAVASIRPDPTQEFGHYSGRILALVCADSACRQPIGGTPIPITYTLDIRQANVVSDVQQLNFNGYTGSGQPSRAIPIRSETSRAIPWVATSNVPWIKFQSTSGSTPANVVVDFAGQDTLPVGTDSGIITISSTRNGSTVSKQIPVAYRLAAYQINPSQSTLSFSGVNGAPFTSQSFTLKGTPDAGVRSVAVSPSAPWITVSKVSGTTNDIFDVGVNPAIATLASGTHSGQVHFDVHSGGQDLSFNVPVNLALVRATLTVNPSPIVLGGQAGRTFAPVPATVSVNTGPNQYAWSLTESGSGNWLSLNKTGGVTGAIDDLQLTGLRSGVTPGTHVKQLAITAHINGDTVTNNVPVNFNLDTHRLIASESGIAMTDTPTFSKLTHTIKVRSNFLLPVAWTATSDQPWLTVTPSGVHGEDLHLTANPSSLGVDQLFTATVTISSTDPSIAEPEKVRVGFWIGSSAPPAQYAITTTTPSMVTDPIRPYMYFPNGNDIHTVNLYTGAELPVISHIANGIGVLAISSDGNTLWVTTGDNHIVAVDLNSRIAGAPFPPGNSTTVSKLSYARIDGVSILLPDLGNAFLPDGTDLGQPTFQPVAVSGDGTKLFYSGARWSLDYTSARGGEFSKVDTGGVSVLHGGNPVRAMAANFDGSRVYVASGVSFIDAYDGVASVSLPSFPTPGLSEGVAVTFDGRLVCTSDNSYDTSAPANVWVYRSDGTLIQSSLVSSAFKSLYSNSGLVYVSGDGHFGLIAIYPASTKIVVLTIAQ